MDNPRYIPTVLSFCSGYAGIERGLDLAGVEHRVIAYVEIEAFAIANLVAKMELGELDPAPIYTDLKTFPAGLFRDAVDIITGGYPCQPFSAAGKRRGHDDPRHLWPYISEAIGIIRPGRVFFENVEGHISLGLNEVVSDLEERGYDTTWGIFSAVEVGAPHQRKRVYIMGDAQGAGSWTGLREADAKQNRARPASASGPGGAGAVADAKRPRLEGYAGDGTGGDEPGRLDAQADGPVGASGVPGSAVPDAGRGGGEGTWGDQCFWPFTPGWCPEPDVGRVVDGCPDRVDRIRLLGNGVVPQTACRAWQVLDAELAVDVDTWLEQEKAIEIVRDMNT